MTDDDSDPDEGTTAPPTFLSSLPDRPITDNVVRRIGESDNPKVRGAMALPGSGPGSVEAFQLDLATRTHVLVFDPTEERWRSYDSFDTEGMDHEAVVDRAAEICNEWLAESLSARIDAAEKE